MKYILSMIIYTNGTLGFLEQFPDSACYKLIKNIVETSWIKWPYNLLEHMNRQTYLPIFKRLYDCKWD